MLKINNGRFNVRECAGGKREEVGRVGAVFEGGTRDGYGLPGSLIQIFPEVRVLWWLGGRGRAGGIGATGRPKSRSFTECGRSNECVSEACSLSGNARTGMAIRRASGYGGHDHS
jgi:hypothetical protein